MLEDPRVLECLDFTQAPYRPVVDKNVRYGPPLAARQLCEPIAHYGVVGGVDELEAVAPAPEEPCGAPRAPRWVADVKADLLLVHGVCTLSSLALSQDRIAKEYTQRIAQTRDLLLVRIAYGPYLRGLIHRSAWKVYSPKFCSEVPEGVAWIDEKARKGETMLC